MQKYGSEISFYLSQEDMEKYNIIYWMTFLLKSVFPNLFYCMPILPNDQKSFTW